MFVIPAVNPVAFTLFGFPVYWYGITMALAIFVAVVTANKLFNKTNPDLKKDLIISTAPLIILIGILGARLYFCLLNPVYYFSNPVEILDIRQGGLSIHGALIFGIAGLIFAAWNKKVEPFKMLDPLACAVIFGQAVGRFGNYFNSEAYGGPVSGQNWGLFIPLQDRPLEFSHLSLYHPAFLYESILDFLGFLILLFIYLKFGKKYIGITFFAYLILYSIIRFFVEQIRIDSACNIGAIPIAQIVSVVLFAVGIIGLISILSKKM